MLRSIDADEANNQAAEKYEVAAGQEPTEQQLQRIEQERMRQALKPFHDPRLREAILNAKQIVDQVIDEQSADSLLRAGFDPAALGKAQSLVTSFKQFIEDHKDEIEALQVLYSKPFRAGLRYNQVKELAKAIQQPPHSLHPERLWQAYEAIEPQSVRAPRWQATC